MARGVQQVLQRYKRLAGHHRHFGYRRTERRGQTDRVARAPRCRLFLSQPFFVAEVFTSIPGEYVDLKETVRGFKEILEGKHDDLPEDAFYLVGTIDQAIEKAKTMASK